MHGYDGVSLRTLNCELGVSHDLLYQRFGSKAAIWRAAVDQAFGTLVNELKASVDPTITDPLQFRLTIRRFLVFSSGHPDVFRLMSSEGNRDTERLDYLFDTYIGPATAPLGRDLDRLIAEGRVRPISLRALHFLITAGGSAVLPRSGRGSRRVACPSCRPRPARTQPAHGTRARTDSWRYAAVRPRPPCPAAPSTS